MAMLRNIETKTIYLERRWRDWFTQVVSCLLLKKPLPVSAPISKNGCKPHPRSTILCKPHPRSTILSQNISYSAAQHHYIPYQIVQSCVCKSYVSSQNSHAACTVSNSNVPCRLHHNNWIVKPYHTSVTRILLGNCMMTLFAIFSLAQCRLLGQHSVVKSYSFHRATDFP